MGTKCCKCDLKDTNEDHAELPPHHATTMTQNEETQGNQDASNVELDESVISNPVVKFKPHISKCNVAVRRRDFFQDSKDNQFIQLETEQADPGERLDVPQILVSCKESSSMANIPYPEEETKSPPEKKKSRVCSYPQKRLSSHKAIVRTESEAVEYIGSEYFDAAPKIFRLENKETIDNKYEKLRKVGQGAFGVVQLVRDKGSSKIMAMKIIAKANCQQTRNFADEIRILQKLDHPNVLRLYEFFQDPESYYLITEYCKGGDLLSKMSTYRCLPEHKVAKVLKQILLGVNYCHKRNIVHRDLKPENIVFESENLSSTLKIIDFGRSRILQYKQTMTDLAGTISYMAPEVIAGCQYNEKCDIWSCGVLMYFMITGFPPYHNKTLEEVKLAVKKGKIEYVHPNWRRTSKEAKDFIEKLLEFDQKKRITASEALKHEFIKKCFNEEKVGFDILKTAVINLKNFKTQMVFQKAVLSYLATYYTMPVKESKQIREIFYYLDQDYDGVISKQDLITILTKAFRDENKARKEAETMIKNVDMNRNGAIDFNEFLVANLEIDHALNEGNLRYAFDFYDFDHDGAIHLEELKRVFGPFCTDETLERIIVNVGTERKGAISYADFKEMMKKYKTRKASFPAGKTVMYIQSQFVDTSVNEEGEDKE